MWSEVKGQGQSELKSSQNSACREVLQIWYKHLCEHNNKLYFGGKRSKVITFVNLVSTKFCYSIFQNL